MSSKSKSSSDKEAKHSHVQSDEANRINEFKQSVENVIQTCNLQGERKALAECMVAFFCINSANLQAFAARFLALIAGGATLNRLHAELEKIQK